MENVTEKHEDDQATSTFYADYFVDYGKLMDEIALIQSPQSTYLVRSRPAQLKCRALNAKRIKFKCNGHWLDDSRHKVSQGTDLSTRLPYYEAIVEISRQEVDTRLLEDSDYTCYCYASAEADSQAVRSESAKVHIAYIRRHFHQSPVSENVTEGQTVQMQCSPPDGEPKVEIFWLKDGKEIERQTDPNIIFANDGSLIISAARLSDSGNYTCEARNVANKRATDPAQILVYVNGQWAEWSEWTGTCNMNCTQIKAEIARRRASTSAIERNTVKDVWPKLVRRRTCNNPAPINGGADCHGVGQENMDCQIDCTIDGQWTKWSSWSQCSENCQRFRTRECDLSLTADGHGDTSCTGRDHDIQNCSQGEGLCTVHPISPTLITDQFQTQLAIYAGLLSVLILLVIFFFLISLLICRCRRRCNDGKKNDIYFSENNGYIRAVLLQQQQRLLGEPSKTPHTITESGENEFYTLTTNASPVHKITPRSVNSSGYSSTRKAANSRLALITESITDLSNGKIAYIRSSTSTSDDNYATLYDYVGDMSERYGSSELNNLPQVVHPAYIGPRGGKLQLNKNGASLLIPAGAFHSDHMIYLAISDEISDLPKLSATETILSSTVMIGLCEECEEETIINRPLIVTFKHCASLLLKDNWSIMVYSKINHCTTWEMITKLGDEDINTPMYCHMDLNRCHIMVERFCKLLLIGSPRRPNAIINKRMRLAVFGPLYRISNDTSIRVYCIPENGIAIHNVISQEENTGILLAQAANFLMREKGSLCVCLEDVSTNFSKKPEAQYLEIPISHHLWCMQNGLHCTLKTDVPEDILETLSGRIVVYQKGNCDVREVLNFDMQQPLPSDDIEDNDGELSSMFFLDLDTRQKLTALFDVPTDPVKDWRGLAKKLNLHRYIQYFATRPGLSPTSLILDLWEAMETSSERALSVLLQAVKTMGRPDAIAILEELLPRAQGQPSEQCELISLGNNYSAS